MILSMRRLQLRGASTNIKSASTTFGRARTIEADGL
jgi:hypothetical protein